LSSHTENPLACRADHAERALVGALLGDSEKKRMIFATLNMGECLSSHRLRVTYTTCLAIHSQGREPDLVCVLDWLQDHGHLDEAGGAAFLASLVGEFVSDLMIEQYCRDVQRAHRRRQMQEALVEAEKKLASGEHARDVWNGLSQKMSHFQQEEQPGGLRVLSASELISEEVPDVKWCLDCLIPSNGFGMIAGESGCGKTWLLLSLSMAVASGAPWLDTFATTKGNVLFIDEESGISLLKDRLLKLGSPEEVGKLPIYFATFEQLKMDTAQGETLLEATIKKTGARLVVIDSFVRIHDAEENSAAEMSCVTEALSRTAREQDCAIVVAHHARKKGLTLNEPGDRLRGTSEIKAALDVHLFVSREKGGAIKIRHDKARFGKTVEPLLVKLSEKGHGQLRLEAVREAVAKVEEAKRAIMDQVTGVKQPVVRRDLEKTVCKDKGVSPRTFGNALGQLMKAGRLEEGRVTERGDNGRAKTFKAYIAKASSSNGGRPHGADFERGG
jgi:predicted ATP-dependent serine protease